MRRNHRNQQPKRSRPITCGDIDAGYGWLRITHHMVVMPRKAAAEQVDGKQANNLGLLAMAWKKGESGNPRGRLTEKVFADALRIVMAETDEVSGKRKLRRIVE